jgi:DNA-binding Xre family transcriptional regulator
MDWPVIVYELRLRNMTLEQIGAAVGMSKGAVHDLMTGRCKTVRYETGVRIVALHKKVMRRKGKL